MAPLLKWFLAVGLMVNAKNSLSICPLARAVGRKTKTTWFRQQRIRSGMAANEASLWQGIVEVERDGRWVVRMTRDLSGKGILRFF